MRIALHNELEISPNRVQTSLYEPLKVSPENNIVTEEENQKNWFEFLIISKQPQQFYKFHNNP
jgi:hypothetical protein